MYRFLASYYKGKLLLYNLSSDYIGITLIISRLGYYCCSIKNICCIDIAERLFVEQRKYYCEALYQRKTSITLNRYL